MSELPDIEIKSTLVSRNITVLGKRTSIRLEPEMWKAIKDISYRENCTIHDLCSLIHLRKNKRTSLTAAIRVFLMLYFRAASTEDGHQKAGHGNFENMKIRAGMPSTWSAIKRPSGAALNGAPVPSFREGMEERAA
jgi:predicted DNA-binding ribbon-helix-helix protein